MPFRDAYKLTGCMVHDCIAKDKTLEELTLDEFKGYSALFENDIYDAIDLVKCCEGRTSYGGPSEASVKNQIALANAQLDAPKSYGLGLAHKHLPEMQKISGLAHTPMFVPVVCDYYCGMQVLVPLDLTLAGSTAEQVAEGMAAYYKDAATVKVHALNEALPENGLYSNAMAGTDRMELYMTVNAAGDQMMLISLFDNLGKGSSGAAVQCMNLMLGLEETEGLE